MLTGVLCGISCLTRITAFTFIFPALAWGRIDTAASPRVSRAKAVALAVAIMASLVAPYLAQLRDRDGDPLLAINYHTAYYRFAEARPIDQPMSAAAYLHSKFVERPITMLDTGSTDFSSNRSSPSGMAMGTWLGGPGRRVSGGVHRRACGLPFFAAGRLLLVVLLGSLVPYMFTWNVGGGGRMAIHDARVSILFRRRWCGIEGTARADKGDCCRIQPSFDGGTFIDAAPCCGRRHRRSNRCTGVHWMPWYVIRESIAHGEATSVETGNAIECSTADGWTRAALREHHRPSVAG